MNATIYKFPSKDKNEVQPTLQLFNDREIDVLITCVNFFSEYIYEWENIDTIDPQLAINCLLEAKMSWYFSEEFINIVDNILLNVTHS
jgi:hypothetical protein